MPPRIVKARLKEAYVEARCPYCKASLEYLPPADQIDCCACSRVFDVPKPAAKSSKPRRIGTDERPLELHYYRLLEVEPTAELSAIKSSYRRLSLKCHPDKNPSPEATEQFKALATAYSVLSDPEARHKYNLYGEQSASDSAAFVDPEAVFSTLFGGEAFRSVIGELSLGAEMKSALQKADEDEGETEGGGQVDKAGKRVLSPEEKAKRDAEDRKKAEERAAARAKRVETLTANLLQKLAIYTEQEEHPDVERSVRAIWSIEADELKKESHGVDLLQSVGSVYVAKAKHAQAVNTTFLGIGGWVHGVRSSAHVFGETVSTLRAAMEVNDIFKELAKAEASGMSDTQKRELEEKAAAKGLDALFKGARLEVESVIREVCDGILYDERVSQTVRDKRAAGLMILGTVYSSVRAGKEFDEAEYVKINAKPASPPPRTDQRVPPQATYEPRRPARAPPTPSRS